MTQIGFPVVNPHAAENRRRVALTGVHLLCASCIGFVHVLTSYQPTLSQALVGISIRAGGIRMAVRVATVTWPYAYSLLSISAQQVTSAARAAAMTLVVVTTTAFLCATELGAFELLQEHTSPFGMSLVQAFVLMLAVYGFFPEYRKSDQVA